MKTPNYPIESLSKDPDDQFFSKSMEITRDIGLPEPTRNVHSDDAFREPQDRFCDSFPDPPTIDRDVRQLEKRLSSQNHRTPTDVDKTPGNIDRRPDMVSSTDALEFDSSGFSDHNFSDQDLDNWDVTRVDLPSPFADKSDGFSRSNEFDRSDDGLSPSAHSKESLESDRPTDSKNPFRFQGSTDKPVDPDDPFGFRSANGGSGGSGGRGKGGQKGGKDNPQNKRRKIIKIALLSVLGVFLAGFISAGVVIALALTDKNMPEWDQAALENLDYASIVYDKNGNEIGRFSSEQNRLAFEYEDVPELLIKTLIAVEDKRFEDHAGVDPIGIIRGIFAGGQGGSGLTVQLAKNVFIQPERRTSRGFEGLKRKIQEAYLAIQIERYYSKNEIMKAYLTHIPFGQGSYGVRSAAQVYFGKELADLTPPEIALLCGLPKGSSYYDPYNHPDNAKARRTDVLMVMRDNNLITAEEYQQYKDEPFTWVDKVQSGDESVKIAKDNRNRFPYFLDYVRLALKNQYGLDDAMITGGGLHIYTTVDPDIQAEAEKVMADPNNFPATGKDGVKVEGAFVMLENETGNIVAMVGGREYPENSSLSLNRAADPTGNYKGRQPGSVAKPLVVYAPAMQKGGFFPGSVFDDEPTSYGSWEVVNYDRTYKGRITMREAVNKSVNTFAVKTYEAVGPDYCWNFAKDKMQLSGLAAKGSESSSWSNALGTFQATPLEIARAYSVFPNLGQLNETQCVTKIEDADGKIYMEAEVKSTQAMDAASAYVMSDMLHSVVTEGTGTRAAIGNWYICGKTGTTSLANENIQGNPDAWFSGYSPVYTAAVWMGYDETDTSKGHYLKSEYGGDRPATIWKKIMTKALEPHKVQSYDDIKKTKRPSGVVDVTYDSLTGKLPNSNLGGEGQYDLGSQGFWWPNVSYGGAIRTDIATVAGAPTEYSSAADYPRSNYYNNDDEYSEYYDNYNW